jgi:hypothetical protein
VGGVHAQESQPSEYQIKAAFLFNFAKFVEWPPAAFPGASSPFVIGVLGENPFGGDLERTIRGKTVGNRRFVIKEVASMAEARDCHILFISTSERKRLAEVLEALRGVSVLTVGEMDGFTEGGGMINFAREARGTRVRFQVNNEAAKKAGMKISSKLLSLALPPAR